MRKSIFDLELRIDIDYEYKKLKEILFIKDGIFCDGYWYSLYNFMNDEIIPRWKYKGIFVDFNDFCERLNINLYDEIIDEESFLYLLELLTNIWELCLEMISSSEMSSCSSKVLGYLRSNVPLIIEKMNYQIEKKQGTLRIIKRDADVDSVLDMLPTDYAELLLDYNDIRCNDLESKKTILKKLDLFIEKSKNTYKKYNNETYNSVQLIVNKMGVNHPIKEEPYKSFNDIELMGWYDKCFKLMIHLIRKGDIISINNECNELVGE